MAENSEADPEVNLAFELAEFATSGGHARPLTPVGEPGTAGTASREADGTTTTEGTESGSASGVATSGPLLWEIAELSTAGGTAHPLGGGGEEDEDEEPGSNVAEVEEDEERAPDEIPGTPSGSPSGPSGGGQPDTPSGVPLPVQGAFMGTPGI